MESSHACSFCLGSEIVEWWVAVAQLAEEHVFSHHWIRMINSVFDNVAKNMNEEKRRGKVWLKRAGMVSRRREKG